MANEKALTSSAVGGIAPSGSLAIPSPTPDQNTGNTDVILPKWIYIKDRDGRFLTQRSGPKYATLTFRSGDPDLECVFETIRSGSRYDFHARGDHPVMRYYSWYSADYPSISSSFAVIHASGDKVYLKDNHGPSLFFSNELKDTGAPVGHDYINASSLMEIEQASIKNEITDIEYDLPGGKVREAHPIIALSTDVRNDSDATVNQTLTYSYEKSTVGTWNNTAGIEIGSKTSFQAGIPLVANATFELQLQASYNHSWGGQDGVRETVTSSTMVIVPPKKKARATVIVRNAHINVGFVYTQKILWADGTSDEQKKSGIYTNVDSWHVDVVLDDWHDV